MAKQSLELYRLVSVGFYFSLQFTVLNPAFPKSLTQSKSWNCLRGIHKLCIEPTNIGTRVRRKLINVVCSLLTSGYLGWNDVIQSLLRLWVLILYWERMILPWKWSFWGVHLTDFWLKALDALVQRKGLWPSKPINNFSTNQ